MESKQPSLKWLFPMIGFAAAVFFVVKFFSVADLTGIESFSGSETSVAESKIQDLKSVRGLSDAASAFEPSAVVRAPNGIIKATVASTSADRERGLSGREGLGYGEGMLFVFENPGRYGFWMKDMNFAIDIVWIDGGKKVVGITADIVPESYPNLFFPPEEISYALELPAGQAADHGIVVGGELVF